MNQNTNQTIKSMMENSEIYVTMERYGYNLWAIVAFIFCLILFKIINKIYLFNMLAIIVMVIFTITSKTSNK